RSASPRGVRHDRSEIDLLEPAQLFLQCAQLTLPYPQSRLNARERVAQSDRTGGQLVVQRLLQRDALLEGRDAGAHGSELAFDARLLAVSAGEGRGKRTCLQVVLTGREAA